MNAPTPNPPPTRRPAGNSSILRDLLDWMLVPLVIAWPVSVIVSYLIAIGVAERQFDRSLVAKVRSLAENVTQDAVTGEIRLGVDLRMLMIDDDAENHELRIDDAIAKRYGGDAIPPPAPFPVPQAEAAATDTALRDAVVRGTRARVVTLRTSPPQARGPITLQLSEPIARREALAREMLLALVPLQILAIPVAAILALLGLRHGIRPLRQLSEDLAKRQPGDLKPVDVEAAPDEIAPLVVAFNDLMQRAASESARQQRFVDNAAHQLRTPITGLRLSAELALRSHDPTDKQRALEDIVKSAERSALTIERLLALARAENALSEGLQPVDLARVATAAISAHLEAARTRHIDLGGSGLDIATPINGNETLLTEMLGNLIDNALQHANDGGMVTVGLVRSKSETIVFVEDDGPGVPPEAREQVWERFYRADSKRHESGRPGTGLGLAIVREIADVHGAVARLAATARGARFEVVFEIHTR